MFFLASFSDCPASFVVDTDPQQYLYNPDLELFADGLGSSNWPLLWVVSSHYCLDSQQACLGSLEPHLHKLALNSDFMALIYGRPSSFSKRIMLHLSSLCINRYFPK